MTTQSKPQTEKLITKWLLLRQKLLTHYWQLSNLPPYSDEIAECDLARFCELLIDYTSFGHFSVYEKIMPPTKGPQSKKISNCFHEISETTDIILDFNDAFDENKQFLDRKNKTPLSKLGEALATRLEKEDALLSFYYQ